MWPCVEIATRVARAYVHVAKVEKGKILDQVVEVAGWSLSRFADRQRNPKYSDAALKVLQKVWTASGGQCGRYLAASIEIQLAALELHGEFVPVQDCYLSPTGARGQIKGKATPGLLEGDTVAHCGSTLNINLVALDQIY